jgi:pimeloyl-ACP methyl ester carboxylesterase
MVAVALPTVVLVHGAFADASGWPAVADTLRERGYPVLAPANPLRGVAADADYVRDFVSTIQGDVVLVGHSYGGCVITNASAGNPRVRALVYIAAFAPDEGETLFECIALGGGSTAFCSVTPTRSVTGCAGSSRPPAAPSATRRQPRRS